MRNFLILVAFIVALARSTVAETVIVDQIGFYFSPREVVINPGDTVRWVWHSSAHTVTEGTDGLINGNELWTSNLNSGTPTFQFTFTSAFIAANPKPGGRYPYFCSPHFSMGMTAAITVAATPPGNYMCLGDGSGTACPCSNTSTQPTGCLNSSGYAARLRGDGVASISGDTLSLSVSGAPESNDVLFFQGTSQVNGGLGAPFGGGLRCAGGAIVRLGVKTISFGYTTYPEAGDASISTRVHATPGLVSTYQCFYRDPPSTCAGGPKNTSNGYVLTWQP